MRDTHMHTSENKRSIHTFHCCILKIGQKHFLEQVKISKDCQTDCNSTNLKSIH